MNLSEHFTLAEAEKSQTALRLGIDNKVPEIYIPRLKLVAQQVLEPIREKFRAFTPSSWYRSAALCKAIGSSPNSQHASGEAVDFEVPGVDNLTLAVWIDQNLSFDQLILEHYVDGEHNSGWVHVSYKEAMNRHQVLRFDGKAYKTGLEDA